VSHQLTDVLFIVFKLVVYAPTLPFGRAGKKIKEWSYQAKEVIETESILKTKYKDFLHLLPEDTIKKLKTPGNGLINVCGLKFLLKLKIIGSLELKY